MARMHIDELDLDEALVRRLLGEQFPEWAELPLRRVEPAGTVNAIFHLRDHLSLRLACREGPTEPGGKEFDWLPRLAPLLPVEIPTPVAQGHPSGSRPFGGGGAAGGSGALVTSTYPLSGGKANG